MSRATKIPPVTRQRAQEGADGGTAVMDAPAMDPIQQERLADLDRCYGSKTTRPGGKYPAVQNPDGTWNILGVPFFAEHKMRESEGGHLVDAAWQQQAVKLATSRWATDQYIAPLIVNHHSVFGDVFAGGFFLPKRVGQATENGQAKACTFVDLLYIREDVYAAFRRGELPYLSSEFVFAPPEHIHLSALDTEAPWFKFPLITIGEETPYTEDAGPATEYPEAAPMAAVRAARALALAMRSHRKETTMSKQTASATAPTPTAQRQEGEGDKKKPEGGASFASVMKGLQEMQASLAKMSEDLTTMIKNALGMEGEGGEGGEKDKPAEQRQEGEDTNNRQIPATPAQASATPAVTPDPEIAKLSPELARRLAETQAELTVLKARDAERGKAEARALALRNAATALSPLQIPNVDAELARVFDDPAMGGEAGLKAYVDACKRHAKPAAPANWNGELPEAGGNDPKEVMAYASRGPETLARARALAQEFTLAKRNGWIRDPKVDLAKYLELAPGMGKPEAK